MISFLSPHWPHKPSRGRAHTPTLLQMEAAECGAAALGIVLGYYGRFKSLDRLRAACGVSRDGSNARSMLVAARALSMTAQGYARTADEVLNGRFPVIVFWGNNHFLVVEGVTHRKVYLNDPALGHRKVARDEFAADYSGIVLELFPSDGFEPGGVPARTLPLLTRRLAGSGRAIGMIAVCSILLGLISIILPALTSVFVDEVLVKKLGNWLDPLLVALGIGIVMQGLVIWLQQITLVRLSTWLAFTQSARFVWQILRLPIDFFAQRQIGDFAQRLEANDRIADLIGGEIGTGTLNVIVAALTAGAILLYEPALGLVAISAALISVGVLKSMAGMRADNSQRLRTDQARMYGASIVGLQTIETLKAAGAEDHFFAKWAGYQARLINTEQGLAWINAVTSVAPQLLFGISNAVIIGLGGLKVMQGELSLGGLVAFQMLAMNFSGSVQQLVSISSAVQGAKGDLTRLEDVFTSPLDWRHLGGSQPAEHSIEGELEISGLTFGYDRLNAPLISGFNLTVAAGGSVALVGGSGSGKSTLGKLICGLLQPWSGEVKIDGAPLTIWPREMLAAAIGVVEQEVVIFEGTIRDNITLWDSTVPQADILKALDDVDLLEAVLAMPQTVDARVEEGGHNLSGGQRQRLDLARAFVRNPKILVLDEATSALDSIAEKMVLDSLRRRRCTTIMVAHRLSTIRDCDEIIVLDRGGIVERGTHEDLLRLHGAYANLLRQE